MKAVPILSLLASCAVAGLGQVIAPAPPPGVKSLSGEKLVALVVPIKWDRFHQQTEEDIDDWQCRKLLLNEARYNVAWMATAFPEDAAHNRYLIPPTGMQDGIRAPASAAYGMAVVLKTGIYDSHVLAVDRDTALRRTVKIIRGVAAVHQANGFAKGWGDGWQSAHWTAMLGSAAWLLWDELDADTREQVARVLEHEANRFASPAYRVPYWTGRDGHTNYPGDTKAEENAWNGMLLQVAVAMMPRHPNARVWRRVGSELMISAFSMRKDLNNATVLDGKPVKKWLHGFNVREDGAVINHNILHPDYTATPTENLRSVIIQSLAGQPIPETVDLNTGFIYRSLSLHNWPSPPYEPPGGPIYQPGRAEVYYPQGTDWSRFRFDIFYLYDLYADAFAWDKGLPSTARAWARVRAARMLAMQARFSDRHMFEESEYKNYAGKEQMAMWQFGDAWLLRWLRLHHTVSPRGNWNKGTP